MTFAEESTAWPLVSRPTTMGGLGFQQKWDMGWMHDALSYFSKDPVHRPYHHNEVTFRALYAQQENFVLPLSHDEVVHGKGSLIDKMPGDAWQKFANLRLLHGWMHAQPGKKLLFMGGEFGQGREWNHDASLDWHLLDVSLHKGVQKWVADLNAAYQKTTALHAGDCAPEGFEWVDCTDIRQSVLSFLRKGKRPEDAVLVVCNFTPIPQNNYRVGVPTGGRWTELLNSDAAVYGGSGMGNAGAVETLPEPCHGRPFCLSLTLPPLSILFLAAPQ
jgi:1,4-alpha-glucan branching enzyme